MRQFKGLLYFGQGQESTRKANKLRYRLEEAIHLASGLQQIPRNDPMYKESEDELQDALLDIVAALLGRECTLGKELPYPGDWR